MREKEREKCDTTTQSIAVLDKMPSLERSVVLDTQAAMCLRFGGSPDTGQYAHVLPDHLFEDETRSALETWAFIAKSTGLSSSRTV